MLILSRKLEESIMIGDDIVIKVVAVHEGQVKLGIEAPKSVRILRTELYEETEKSNVQAASAQKSVAVEAARRLGQSTPASGLPTTVRPKENGFS
jgi:carbon storage regulator